MSGNYDGPLFTRFPHFIVEAMALTKLSGNEIRILLVIARKTYGWGGEWDIISYSQFEQSTGLPKDSIAKSFRKLVSKNIIEVKNPIQKAWSPLRINPNFTTWRGYTPPLPQISAKERIKKINDNLKIQTTVSTNADSKTINTHTNLGADKHTKKYAETHITIERGEKGIAKSFEREDVDGSPQKGTDAEKQQSFLPPRDEQLVNQLVEAWNKIALGRIPEVKFIPRDSVRFKKVLTRMNNKIFRENYKKVLKIITVSPFLRGEIKDFKATFDWFLVEGNFIKILEGNYIKEEKNSKSKNNRSEDERYYRGPDLKEVN